MNLNTV